MIEYGNISTCLAETFDARKVHAGLCASHSASGPFSITIENEPSDVPLDSENVSQNLTLINPFCFSEECLRPNLRWNGRLAEQSRERHSDRHLFYVARTVLEENRTGLGMQVS